MRYWTHTTLLHECFLFSHNFLFMFAVLLLMIYFPSQIFSDNILKRKKQERKYMWAWVRSECVYEKVDDKSTLSGSYEVDVRIRQCCHSIYWVKIRFERFTFNFSLVFAMKFLQHCMMYWISIRNMWIVWSNVTSLDFYLI